MRIEQVINTRMGSFERELAGHLDDCRSFTIASAFVDKAGIAWLNRLLDKKAGVRRHGRLLTGLLNRFNTRVDLHALQQLTIRYSEQFHAAISMTKRFH